MHSLDRTQYKTVFWWFGALVKVALHQARFTTLMGKE